MKKKDTSEELEKIKASLKANEYLLNKFPTMKNTIEKENNILLERIRKIKLDE